jgi:hypothetical protein
MEGLVPVANHDSYLLDLKIKNHGSMAALTTGKATKADINTLISMSNVTEALYRLGFGTEYANVVRAGLDSLFAVGQRGAQTKQFVLKAQEMTALNTLMELHDAQLEIITVKDMERALKLVDKERKEKKMRSIKEPK